MSILVKIASCFGGKIQMCLKSDQKISFLKNSPLADLENHNKDGGQWIVVHGHVYDLEDFRSASAPMSDCEDITKIVEAVASQGRVDTILIF